MVLPKTTDLTKSVDSSWRNLPRKTTWLASLRRFCWILTFMRLESYQLCCVKTTEEASNQNTFTQSTSKPLRSAKLSNQTVIISIMFTKTEPRTVKLLCLLTKPTTTKRNSFCKATSSNHRLQIRWPVITRTTLKLLPTTENRKRPVAAKSSLVTPRTAIDITIC